MSDFAESIWLCQFTITSYRKGTDYEIRQSGSFRFPTYGINNPNQEMLDRMMDEAARHTEEMKCNYYRIEAINRSDAT
jgi:hypothetical protein